jgi:hypothetical protein
MRAFIATPHTTTNISVGAGSARVLVTNQAAGSVVQVRVVNNGTATAWFAFGDVTIAASVAADTPLPPGAVGVFTALVPDGGSLYAAAIAAGATGSIYFTPGSDR